MELYETKGLKKSPLEKTKEELIEGFKQYLDKQPEICKDNENVLRIMPALLQLQNDKGRVYGRSWCKHSDLSAFFNLERKWDRIYTIMERAMKEGTDVLWGDASSTPTETFLDTIVDLGLYSIMWAGYIMENHPEQFQKFLDANKLNP